MSYYRKDGEMTMRILKEPKQYVALEKENLRNRIEKLRWTPKLAIVQVGNNEASNRYVRNKVKDCEEVGIAAAKIADKFSSYVKKIVANL